MANFWDNVKNYLNSVPFQSTYVNTDKPKTSDVTKPKTPATIGNGAGASGDNGISGVQYGANKLAEQLGDVSANIIPAAGSGGGGSGSGSSGATDAVYNAYAQAQARQEALYRQQDDLHRQKEELAAKQRDDLKATLLAQNEAAKKQRETVLNATLDTNNQAADKSLREAYIAYMLGKRNMPQELKAMGISGGATETTLNDAHNTYMNNRFGIEDGRNDANAIARRDYDTGVNSDYVNYMAALNDVDNAYANRMFDLLADKNNFLMERASNAASAGQSLADALASIPKSTTKATTAATSTPASVATGYKLGNITAKDEVDLYQKLMNAGYRQEVVEQYLLDQGVIKPSSVGGSYR